MPLQGAFDGGHAACAGTTRSIGRHGCTARLRGGRNGTWLSRDRWVQDVSCGAAEALGHDALPDGPTLRRCLAGRSLVFIGDSLTRGLFLRLIWHVRRLPAIVEHYFHRHAAYTWNVSSDELQILGARPLSIFPAKGCVPCAALMPRLRDAVLMACSCRLQTLGPPAPSAPLSVPLAKWLTRTTRQVRRPARRTVRVATGRASPLGESSLTLSRKGWPASGWCARRAASRP